MAASNSAPRPGSSADDDAEPTPVGMAHLTVVPANFEPDGSGDRDE